MFATQDPHAHGLLLLITDPHLEFAALYLFPVVTIQGNQANKVVHMLYNDALIRQVKRYFDVRH